MKVKELIQRLKQIPEDLQDHDIVVDTEGAEYKYHLVSIIDCFHEHVDFGDDYTQDFIYLTLDNRAKTFRTNDE